jgi:hypothetical protein
LWALAIDRHGRCKNAPSSLFSKSNGNAQLACAGWLIWRPTSRPYSTTPAGLFTINYTCLQRAGEVVYAYFNECRKGTTLSTPGFPSGPRQAGSAADCKNNNMYVYIYLYLYTIAHISFENLIHRRSSQKQWLWHINDHVPVVIYSFLSNKIQTCNVRKYKTTTNGSRRCLDRQPHHPFKCRLQNCRCFRDSAGCRPPRLARPAAVSVRCFLRIHHALC